MTITDDRAYSVADLARKWNCSDDAIYDMIDDGRIKAFEIGRAPRPDKNGRIKRRGLRISAKEAARWEGEHASGSQPTPPAHGLSAGIVTREAPDKRLLRSAARVRIASA